MSKKQRQIKDRIQILKALLLPNGFELKTLTPFHFRVIGYQTVDYWPSTNLAWVVGTNCDAVVQITPYDVLEIARHKVLPEGAAEHMHAL
jgi:hypothetical protein